MLTGRFWLYWPFCLHSPTEFQIIFYPDLLTMSVLDEGCSGNMSCTLDICVFIKVPL